MRVVVIFAEVIRRRPGIQAAVGGPCGLYDWEPWVEVAGLERRVVKMVRAGSWSVV